MNRRHFLLTSSAVLTSAAASAASKGSTLIVNVAYGGTGTVDEGHKVYVALWDSPAFMKDGDNAARPLAVKPIQAKSASVTFNDVQKSPVYVSMAFDPAGKWDGMSQPPVGSSLGIYAKDPGLPAPVSLQSGKTTTISATFDDLYKKS